MVQWHGLGWGVVALVSTLALGAAACGSTVSQGGGGGNGQAGAGGTAGSGGSGGNLPGCAGGQDVVLAIDKLFLGDTDFSGAPNPSSAWKQFGRNIDGLTSTKTSTDLCKPAGGGSVVAAYPDGKNGIDNSFGKNLLPIFLGLSSDLSTTTNQAIAAGRFSYLLSIKNLGNETTCATDSVLYRGDDRGMPAKWDGSDTWPIDPFSLMNPPDLSTSLCQLPDTSVSQDWFRGRLGGTVDLLLGDALGVHVPIHFVELSMQLDPDHQGAAQGQLSGVIDTQEFLIAFQKAAGLLDTSFCFPDSPTLKTILKQLSQASDIMKDGSQDPSKVCDGISIGVGFTMRAVHLGNVATPKPPPPDPCIP